MQVLCLHRANLKNNNRNPLKNQEQQMCSYFSGWNEMFTDHAAPLLFLQTS